MSKVENGHLVSINYVVTDKVSGDVLDSSNNQGKPLIFLLGQNQVIIGLEKALIGKNIGEKFKVEISPEDAYGVRNPDFLQEVPKDQFQGIDLKKGMTLFGQGDNGETVQVVVDEIGETSVIIDYNHPLSSKTLVFDVEILSSKEPTEEELVSYIPPYSSGSSGCCGGGHHHDTGGCCGGGHHHGGGCGCSH